MEGAGEDGGGGARGEPPVGPCRGPVARCRIIAALRLISLAPGTRLGPYEIVSILGAGGMGAVYRARDHKLVRDVAIKTVPQRSKTSQIVSDQRGRAADVPRKVP